MATSSQPTSTATTIRVRDGKTLITDGPFAETKEALGGYYLIEAADLDEAIALAKAARARTGARSRSARSTASRAADGGIGAPLTSHATHEVVDRLFREESGRAVATLIRVLGDFDLAEEAVQDAFAKALETWPARGVPDNPAAWITTTARNAAIDRIRRRRRARGQDRRASARGRDRCGGRWARTGRRRATRTPSTTGCG